MARIKEPSTLAAGGTPWKGRLRSHHATPQSLPPPRLSSRTKSREAAEEAHTSRKRAAPKIKRRGGSQDEDAGAARPLRRSLRLAGREPEHPIVINGAGKECKARDDQSAVTPLRRSPRFHTENKNPVTPLFPPNLQQFARNRKTHNASRKDKNQRKTYRNAAANALPSAKNLKEPSLMCQTSQDIPPQQKSANVSRRKSEDKELKADHCEVLAKKRKRGTEGRSLSESKSCQKPRSMPPDCQEVALSNGTRNLTPINGASFVVQPNIGDVILMNVKKKHEEPHGIEREGKEPFGGQDDWTKEQDMALRQAYFTARPSPHFWKRVSKLVPGRSAEECFNKIHADLSTPTPIAPRPRRGKAKFSPVGSFSLSDPELPNLLEPTVGKQKTYKQKNLAAQKTVRHLLQKHCLIDQAQEADHFSIFESSPSALQLNISFEDSPGTPHSCMNSGSPHKCSASSSARKIPFSRLKSNQDEPSPAVLKPVKNAVLHEKYINQLVRREGAKGPRRRAPGSKAAHNMKPHPKKQAGNLKAAKNALISEATDFISQFKKLQANSLANIVENSEDDENEGCSP
ncbi:hypothetical protein EJB05_44196 [Eragrostis curvula]|uniref:Myb-like domain-containing protein n=1 Tax=Eragrostis curvula TaxID=38414 RepID=A0A5J9TH80_9POAL|nr:hypothetical protein EJB05_44196 [Eragrostis curvula]